MTLTKYGRKEWLTATVLALFLLALCIVMAVLVDWRAGVSLAVFIVIVWIAFAAFFRDPERRIPEDPEVLVSPADGVVRESMADTVASQFWTNAACVKERVALLQPDFFSATVTS